MSIPWNPIYSVHLRVIDEQHKRFVGIISQLDDAVREGRAEAELKVIFLELEEYMKIHFATEEMYFDKFGYEGTAVHKAAHASFAAQVADFRTRAEADPKVITLELIEFLHDWLADHVAHMDKAYVKCFHEHGLT